MDESGRILDEPPSQRACPDGPPSFMNVSVPVSDPLDIQVKLCNTAQCRELASEISAFENETFGADFACSVDSVQAWFESGCLFCAALCTEPNRGPLQIHGMVSALLTSEECCAAFLDHQSSDAELVPWFHSDPASHPSLYLASVISRQPQDLERLYPSLAKDLATYLEAHQLAPQTAFAVASGPDEQAHMLQSGFQLLEVGKYLGKYPFLTLNASLERPMFWRQLLRGESTKLTEAFSPALIQGLDIPSRMNPIPITPEVETDWYREGREVERRLAESKRERYRHMKKSF